MAAVQSTGAQLVDVGVVVSRLVGGVLGGQVTAGGGPFQAFTTLLLLGPSVLVHGDTQPPNCATGHLPESELGLDPCEAGRVYPTYDVDNTAVAETGARECMSFRGNMYVEPVGV